jgi:cytochrome c biogenesis protein CcmG/thiol:disulfide interchange protein DsbE
LVAAAAAYADLGVSFVGISYQDRPEDAVTFLDEFGRGYTYATDATSRAALEFGVFGVPETFFVDRNGIVVGKIAGAADPTLLAATLDAMILGEAVDSVQTGPVQSER